MSIDRNLIGRLEFIRDYECKVDAEVNAINEAIAELSKHTEEHTETHSCVSERTETHDLISRKAAIDALCSECQGQCIPCDSYPCSEVETINTLPSAQPELIKQGAYVRGFEQGRTQGMIDAQDLQPTCNKLATDCISRQAAIDAIKSRKTAEQSSAGIMRNAVVDFCIDIVKKLPSAQPEIIRCKGCKHKHLENAVWTCPFGLPGGPDFYCGYGAERRTDE